MRRVAKWVDCKAEDLMHKDCMQGYRQDAKEIDRDIRAAIAAERARCVGVVEKCQRETVSQIPFVVCDDIIKRMKGGE